MQCDPDINGNVSDYNYQIVKTYLFINISIGLTQSGRVASESISQQHDCRDCSRVASSRTTIKIGFYANVMSTQYRAFCINALHKFHVLQSHFCLFVEQSRC